MKFIPFFTCLALVSAGTSDLYVSSSTSAIQNVSSSSTASRINVTYLSSSSSSEDIAISLSLLNGELSDLFSKFFGNTSYSGFFNVSNLFFNVSSSSETGNLFFEISSDFLPYISSSEFLNTTSTASVI